MNLPSRALLCALVLAPTPAAHAQHEPQTLPAVRVAGRQADSLRKPLEAEAALTPGGVTVVDGEELRQRPITRLADALRYVPGLWAAAGAAGDSSFLSARGSNLDATAHDGNGIKLLVDGLPVTAGDGNNHNRDVDALSARHVVVARGANALTYGASTLGGAIDFITPTARDGARDELLLNGGSHGQRQARATLGTLSGGFDALATLETRHSDGYRDHQRQRRTGFYANAGWQLGNGVQTRFYATAIDNEQQLPGALTQAQLQADPGQANAGNVTGDYQYNVKTWRLANRTSWQLDADRSLTAGVSLENQRLFHPIVYSPHFSLLIDTEQRNAGATLRYQQRIGAHDLLVGLNAGRTTVTGGNYSYTPGGARSLAARVDNDATSVELFAMDRWRFAPGWTAVYGAQLVSASREVRNYAAAGGAPTRNPAADYDRVNPRVGLIHQLTPAVQLFANLSRLHEAPTTYELDDDVRGNNATLDAMHGSVAEFGTRGQWLAGATRWHWDVAVYYAKLQDEILSRDKPGAPGTSQSLNVDGTVHAGLEALLGASVAMGGGHRIESLVSVTVNRFRFAGDATYGDRQLPAAPRHAIKGELMWRHAGGAFAGPTFDIVGMRWADLQNTYRVDGYTLWGLRGGFAAPDWEVHVEARNLGGRRYASQLSVRDVAAADAAVLTPGESRSAYVGLRLKF